MTPAAQLQQHLVDAFNRRDWDRTIGIGERLLARLPQHPGAHYLCGIARLETGHLTRALAHLHTAAERVPDRADVLASYARALAEAQLHDQALRVITSAERHGPLDAPTCTTLALTLTRMQMHDRAAPLYAEAARQRPGDAHLHHHLALAHMFGGDLDAARREVEVCLRIDPGHWPAYDTRAELGGDNADDRVREMETLLRANAQEPLAVEHLCMALSRECDRLGRSGEAFAHVSRAKALGRARQAYDAAADEQHFESLMRHAPAVADETAGYPDPAPIFVVGLPRSGTTLVERILASHPRVQGLGELHQFGTALMRQTGTRSRDPLEPRTIRTAQEMEWHALGAEYLRATAHLRNDAERFVDKLPHNFLFLGHIANALPRAPLICLRRHPLDVCLGNYMQRFGEGSPLHAYSHDLLDIGRYYILFDRLMTFWKQRLPGRILEVGYERLVDHQETVTREILAFCALPWDDTCLAFHRHGGAVGTASAAQVRSPIHRHSVGRWERYAEELEPLRDLLVRAGITVN